MHLLLTDRLSCPRCGPGFGLILRADRMEGRQVIEGILGCPNCRDAFPVSDGFADLRAPPRDPLGEGRAGMPPDPASAAGTDGEADRLVALLGIVGGPGTVALVGEPARLAPRIAAALPEVLVLAVDPDLRHWPETPEVSRLAAAPGLPIFDAILRGVALDGRLGETWLREAARVLQPRARLVVLHAPDGVDEVLRASGLTSLAAEGQTIVATRG